ncbi:MAG TPA: nucleoside phosphorylase [Candidatus Avimuribaculum pullicola]|nr:nucleoside phosphorylase [Candidatus Avimuribaculum pullicola]
MKKSIESSEMIINDDGSIFHLHLRPEQLRDNIIVVGDPARVDMVASFFDSIDYDVSSREFHTIAGTYGGKHIMCLSHGIGGDNIDIVMNELDALANIDFSTRQIKDSFRQLTVVRVGTSGGLQPDLPVGTFVIAQKGIGFDGVINFYADRNKVCDLDFEHNFCATVGWNPLWAKPYVVDADPELVERIGRDDMKRGCTISANGFYGPQGRQLRLQLADPQINSKIEAFRYKDYRITNYEMESAALQGLGKMFGHKTMTVCAIIANRLAGNATSNYKSPIKDLVQMVLDRI